LNLEKKKTVFLVCLIVVLLVSVFSVRLLLSVERPQGEEYKLMAEQLLSEARQEFENIRGLSVRNVTLEVVNQSWVTENWGVAYIDPEEMTMEENVYKALFMVSQNVNLTDVQLEWTGMFRAAKWNGKIYVVEENFDVTDGFKAKSTFVHELTHIMQETYSLPTRKTFDGAKALTSLKEGDATLMADTFKNDGLVPVSYSVTYDGETSVSVPLVLMLSDDVQLSLPPTIDDINRFPYHYGVEFVRALYQQGGWETVNEAYMNPPTTTEQIMHPDKYFAQEDAKTIGAPAIADGWSLKKTDRFGEYFILVMLGNWLSEADAKNAAEGWGGDIINYYEKDDDFLFTWNIVWDSKDDAYDFYSNFNDMLYEASAEKHNCSYWSAYGRYISIQWNENSTLIISSANETLVQQSFLG
jgi:hypothetical protein